MIRIKLLTQSVRWLAFLVFGFTCMLKPSLGHAQAIGSCSSGTVDYRADDGDWGNDIEQTVCLYYDPLTGLDSSVETDNDAYQDWGDLNSIWVFGVGAEGQLLDSTGFNTIYDSGMQSGTLSDTGGGAAYVSFTDAATYNSYILVGLYSECMQLPGELEDRGCNWTDATDSFGVSLDIPLPPPATISLASSASPGTYLQPETFTAAVSDGATGQVTFLDRSVPIGAGTIAPATITNLIPYSQQFANPAWAPYCGNASNISTNISDLAAPDGTMTATKFVLPTDHTCGTSLSWGALTFAPNSLQAGQSYTVSVWLRGAHGGEGVIIGLNDCAAAGVTLTTAWQRYTATWTSISSDIATCEGGRGFEMLGISTNLTYYAWGAQTEQATTAGPYIATGATPQTWSGGVASLTTSALAGGIHLIYATWPGNSNLSAATSNSISLPVNAATPSLSVTSSNLSIGNGDSVTFTASISDGLTGTVYFFDDGWNMFGTGVLSNGSASYTTNTLTGGNHPISAYWVGNLSYSSVTSSSINQFVARSTPAVAVTCSPATIPFGSQVSCSASVGGGATGPISFAYNGNTWATATLVNGTASASSVGILGPGSYNVVASYGGDDSNNAASGSSSFTVSSASAGGPLYVYLGNYDTNGNVTSYSDTVMGPVSFTYDQLNRLKTATSSWAINGLANFTWSYDPFGNRTQQYASGPGGTSVQNASFTNQNQSIGVGYDGAGDVNYDGRNAYLYDAEGRICAVNALPPYSGMTGYLYDAAGNRIAKGSITSMSCDVTQNGFQQQEAYVVGPAGEQLTEVGANNSIWNHTNVYAGGKLIGTYDTVGLHFHIDDPLGTRRAQISSAGVLEATYQSLPYGDGYNAIPMVAGAVDPTEQHFTGKERDMESGNDYFGARYYASSTGRFMSPDWAVKSTPVPYAELSDPQSLNLYSYVRNNPMSRFDKDGHCDAPTNLKAGQVGICVASYISAKKFDIVGDGDNRGTNGNGGTSRIQTTFTIDASGKTEKPTDGTADKVAQSTVLGMKDGLQGTGSSTVSPGASVDTNGNMHLSVDQSAHSAYDLGGALGDISNHVNLVVTPGGQVGVDSGSTARQFPSLEIYRYTTDGTTVTTTLVHNYQETSPSALRQPEQPLATQVPQ